MGSMLAYIITYIYIYIAAPWIRHGIWTNYQRVSGLKKNHQLKKLHTSVFPGAMLFSEWLLLSPCRFLVTSLQQRWHHGQWCFDQLYYAGISGKSAKSSNILSVRDRLYCSTVCSVFSVMESHSWFVVLPTRNTGGLTKTAVEVWSLDFRTFNSQIQSKQAAQSTK